MITQERLARAMYLALVIGAGSLSWEMGQAMAKEQESLPATRTVTAIEKPSFFTTAKASHTTTISETDINVYYFHHVSDFAPLPHSPRERAKALREIHSVIRQKLDASHQIGHEISDADLIEQMPDGAHAFDL